MGIQVSSGQAHLDNELGERNGDSDAVVSNASEEGDRWGDSLDRRDGEAVETVYEHLRWAQTCGFHHKEITLDPCLRRALGSAFGCPEEHLQAMKRQCKIWSERKESLCCQRTTWSNTLTEWYRGSLGRLDPFVLQEMLEAIDHCDGAYVADLHRGFNVTGEISLGGLGTSVPGGLLREGKSAAGYVPFLPELHDQCKEINVKTAKRAAAARPTCKQDWELAWQVWRKTTDEIACGRAGPPAL